MSILFCHFVSAPGVATASGGVETYLDLFFVNIWRGLCNKMHKIDRDGPDVADDDRGRLAGAVEPEQRRRERGRLGRGQHAAAVGGGGGRGVPVAAHWA